jgi:hypothetical protein
MKFAKQVSGIIPTIEVESAPREAGSSGYNMVFTIKYIKRVVKNNEIKLSFQSFASALDTHYLEVLKKIDETKLAGDTGIDANTTLSNRAFRELERSIVKTAIARLFKHGAVAADSAYRPSLYDRVASFFNREYVRGSTVKTRKQLRYYLMKAIAESHKQFRLHPDYIITNSRIASEIMDLYEAVPYMDARIADGLDLIYPVLTIFNVVVYVDPTMRWNDNRMLVGKSFKNNEPDVAAANTDTETPPSINKPILGGIYIVVDPNSFNLINASSPEIVQGRMLATINATVCEIGIDGLVPVMMYKLKMSKDLLK